MGNDLSDPTDLLLHEPKGLEPSTSVLPLWNSRRTARYMSSVFRYVTTKLAEGDVEPVAEQNRRKTVDSCNCRPRFGISPLVPRESFDLLNLHFFNYSTIKAVCLQVFICSRTRHIVSSTPTIIIVRNSAFTRLWCLRTYLSSGFSSLAMQIVAGA